MIRADRITKSFGDAGLDWVPCALCGVIDTRAIYVKFNLVISRCRQCGLSYANPRLQPDDIKTRYSRDYFWNEYLPSTGVRDGRVDFELMDRHHSPMLDVLRREVPPPAKMLEIGTGAGIFLKVAERAGWSVIGIELSPDAAQFARGLGLDVRQETAEQMSIEPDSRDVVVMFDTIEHLLDPLSVIRTVHRVLRAGGVLVITTPNFNALSRFALGRDWAILSPAEHLYYFTQRTLRDLLLRVGFSTTRFERFLAPGAFETMNPANSHHLKSARNVAYRLFVRLAGPIAFRGVQAVGLADQLVVVAKK